MTDSSTSSSPSSQDQVKTVSFGLWWPTGDPDKLREAAEAWNAIADHLDRTTTTLAGAVGAVTKVNSGTAIDAFADHWQRTGGPRGALPTIARYCRDMSKALSDFAGEVDKARGQILELAAEIVASVAIGVGLAFFTAGLSAAAAEGTTLAIMEAATQIGISLSREAATIIARVATMAALGSAESMATNTVIQLGSNLAFNENHNPLDGFNLDEVSSAGEFGFLAGETIGGIQSLRGLGSNAAKIGGFDEFITCGNTSQMVSKLNSIGLGRALARPSSQMKLADYFANQRVPTSSELNTYAQAQGWTRSQTETGPIKYTDNNGVVRLTLKKGSPRAPGSENPHVEIRDAQGNRTDPFGNQVTRKSPDNHTPIIWDDK